jgi:hypothetical protein
MRGSSLILEAEGLVSAVERTFATHLQQVQTSKGRIKLAAAERHLTMPDERPTH